MGPPFLKRFLSLWNVHVAKDAEVWLVSLQEKFAEFEIFELQMRTERKIFFCPTLLVTPLCAWSIWKIFTGNRQKVWVEIRLNEHSFIYAMIKKKQFVLSFSYVSAHWDKVSCCSLWDLKSSNQVNGSKAGSLPELHPGRCWVAPQQVRKLAFFPPLSKTNTASDWSIYSRDFTRVHLEECICTVFIDNFRYISTNSSI